MERRQRILFYTAVILIFLALVIRYETLMTNYDVVTAETMLKESFDPADKRHVMQHCNLQSVDMASNKTDWSFTNKLACFDTKYDNHRTTRRKMIVRCHKAYPAMVFGETDRTDDIFQVKFGDYCLRNFIENRCREENRVVPNVVHYVWCKKQALGFFQFLSFMSVLRFIRPCLLLLHGDYLPFGKYWNYFVGIYPNLVHVKRECPAAGNKQFYGYFEHGTDVMRIEALLAYGGIYLDWDEVMLQSVDHLRKYEHTQGYELPDFLGPQFIMAKRNSRFLQHWYRGYERHYKKNSWNYNSMRLPALLADKYPDIIHTEGYRFVQPNARNRHLLFDENYNWSDNYAIHLYITYYKNFTDEYVIRNLNTTLGAVARHVLYGNKELCM